jgi:AcrR family transcriptional regulator
MAWDTEGTKRKLLEAGARQFAAHGYAGARMDAIGRDAGVNKERVYQYFGGKDGLYGAVLADRLDQLLDGVEVRGAGPEAVGRYAGELFDRFRADPAPARLLAWESLELGGPVAAEGRAELCRQRAGALRASLPGLDAASAAHLLLSIVTLAAGWWTLAHLAGVILGGAVSDAERRASLVRQATGLSEGSLRAPAVG